MKVVNVILSGGVGSRLWPLSRKNNPKQYLEIFQGKSLFMQTAHRNQKLCDRILVVGNLNNSTLTKQSLSELSLDYQEIIEVLPRNTAAAIAFAAFSCNAEDVLLITPSDHLIPKCKEYDEDVKKAIDLAKEGFMVTFGLKPTRPETGFGYIQIKGNEVLSFKEKPDLETAKKYIENGDFYWNSGMFCFKVSTFLNELQSYQPKLYELSKEAFDLIKDNILPFEESLEIPSLSVDYAIMEHTNKLKAVASQFQWSDMGSFEAVYDYLLNNDHPVDKSGNMVIGSNIYTEFLGLQNCILVQTQDAVLVLSKDCSQDVKEVYCRIEKEFPNLI